MNPSLILLLLLVAIAGAWVDNRTRAFPAAPVQPPVTGAGPVGSSPADRP